MIAPEDEPQLPRFNHALRPPVSADLLAAIAQQRLKRQRNQRITRVLVVLVVYSIIALISVFVSFAAAFAALAVLHLFVIRACLV